MKAPIPAKLNWILFCAITMLIVLHMAVMPMVFANPWLMTLVAFVLIPLNTPLWSLIHEAIHRNFNPDKDVNERIGRLMSIVFGASFHILRFGHLMHHQYNREWESEFYQEEKKNKFLVYANHYFKMLGGLYIIEIIMTFMVALTPAIRARKIAEKLFPDERHQQAVFNMILKDKHVRQVRIDCVLIVLFYSACFMVYGTYWPVLALILAGRGVIISLMDNAYHYGTPLDNSVIAKELKVPSLLGKFILNFNHHFTHHENVGLPWLYLRDEHKARNNIYAEDLGTALITQFKGPVKIQSSPGK